MVDCGRDVNIIDKFAFRSNDVVNVTPTYAQHLVEEGLLDVLDGVLDDSVTTGEVLGPLA